MSVAGVSNSPSPPLQNLQEREKCKVNPFIRWNWNQVYSNLTNQEIFFPAYAYPVRKYTPLPPLALPFQFQKFIETIPYQAFNPILISSDLEIISDDAPLTPAYNQIRESDAKYFFQLYEDIGYCKTCLKIDGSPEFFKAVMKDIKALLTRPGGRQLIGTICSTLKNSCIEIREETIGSGYFSKLDNDPDFNIHLNVKNLRIFAVRDQKGEVHFERQTSYGALAHEFIHLLHKAARAENPDCLPSDELLSKPCNRLFKNLDEKLTIWGHGNLSMPCENTLRAEFGLLPRISHMSSEFLEYTPQDLPNIETPNQNNINRIENAVYLKAYGEIRTLLKAGANPGNAFTKAILLDDLEMILFLLQEGASPCKPDRWGCLPLRRAAERDCPEIVKLLIDQRVRIDERDPKGQTALQAALQKQLLTNALLLIANGARFTREAYLSIPEPALREPFRERVPPEMDDSAHSF